MNQIRNIQRLNQRELEAGISIEASWHSEYNDTAYIYFGSLPYELTEGDILIIFSQYGIPVHLKLVRDKETGKSKGFGWLKYEDQRSTILAVDNLNGTKVLGRVIRVDHAYYEERERDEEYEKLLEEELKNDFANKEYIEKEMPPKEKNDEEFEDPLVLMNALEKNESEEMDQKSKRHRDGKDRERRHRHRSNEEKRRRHHDGGREGHSDAGEEEPTTHSRDHHDDERAYRDRDD